MSPAAVATASSKSRSHSKHSRCIPTHKRELMPTSLDMNLFREISQQFTTIHTEKGPTRSVFEGQEKGGFRRPEVEVAPAAKL